MRKKILFITDSHGNFLKIYDIIKFADFNMIISTGDYCDDAEEISYVYPEIEYHIVKGNCDFYNTIYKEIEIFEVEDKKILITHGHLFNVKGSMSLLEKEAEKEGVDLVCFGHTHIPYLKEKNGIKYFNPGALKDGNYGVLIIDKENIELKMEKIKI